MENIKVKMLSKTATKPSRAHPDDAGLDLFCSEDTPYKDDTLVLVPTGVALAIPKGYVGLIRDRSSTAKYIRLKVTGGVIDAGYTGEVNIMLENLSGEHGCVRRGQKIAQILLIPVSLAGVEVVEELSTDTERKAKGFGSSGHGVDPFNLE